MVVWGLGTSYQCSLRGLVAQALIAGGQVGIALCAPKKRAVTYVRETTYTLSIFAFVRVIY